MRTGFFPTPLGIMRVTEKDDVVVGMHFVEEGVACGSLSVLCAGVQEQVLAYFRGSLTVFSLPFYAKGTPFQQAVWKALLDVSYGTKASYQSIALAIGKPLACRAVARACGANPLVVMIPCHRIVYAQGGIGGYNACVERKKALLFLEASHAPLV